MLDSHRRRRLGGAPLRAVGGLFLFACALLVLGVAPVAHADDPPAPAQPAPPVPAQPAPEGAAPEGPAPEEPEPESERLFEFHNEQMIERADGEVVYFYRTNFVKPSELIKSLQALGIHDLKMQPLDVQNQVLLQGHSDIVAVALDAVNYFDVSTPQVFIETEVIEITWDSNFEFGLDWLMSRDVAGPDTVFRGTEGVLNPPSFLSSQFPPNFPFQGASLDFGLVGGLADKWGALGATIQALQINGKAEVLSRPSILATQGVPATVSTEEAVPIARFDTADNNVQRFKFDSLRSGVELKVTAIHIGDNYVTLKVAPNVRGLQGVAANRLAGAFAPIATTRKAETTVTMADGSTLVIGGLYTNTSTTEKAKTPILSDLPLIGDILTRTRETKRKTELIFLLTPRIVRKGADLKIVIPPSEVRRLEEGDAKPECPEWKGPFGIRKPGAYLDELDD